MELSYAVYILKCANGKYYTGYTTNIGKRLIAHNKGDISFAKDKLPIVLVHLSFFANKQKAYDFERYLKPFQRLLLFPTELLHQKTQFFKKNKLVLMIYSNSISIFLISDSGLYLCKKQKHASSRFRTSQ